MSREILCLILARGGSKSIPRKNILPLLGKPLLAYTIDHARASRHITRTIVSTDDPEIAEVARAYGAEVPFLRPAEFSRDESVDYEAFRHALEWLRDHEGRVPEIVVQLRATGPIRDRKIIDGAIEALLADSQADSVKSVSRPSESPFKMWRQEGNRLKPLLALEGIAEPHTLPRQRLPQVYWQNGYVDVIRSRTILDLNMMYGHEVLPFVVDEKMHELDYPSDIPVIEELLKAHQAGVSSPSGPREEQHSV